MRNYFNQNQIFITHKSTTCVSKNGNPLSEYRTFQEAQESADYQYSQTGTEFTPYECDICGMYHLKPTAYYCEHSAKFCSCTDHNGKRKDAYATKADAEKMMGIRAQAGVQLYMYRCPQGNGFHLTSRKGY